MSDLKDQRERELLAVYGYEVGGELLAAAVKAERALGLTERDVRQQMALGFLSAPTSLIPRAVAAALRLGASKADVRGCVERALTDFETRT